jgi:hypothetical protein
MSVFMIGIQRSGSNLLRLMLNQLPDIAAPHPPHILQRMMPLVPGYGDLEIKENFMLLVDDICRLVEHNPVAWEGVDLDRKTVAKRCRERSLMAVFGAVYDLMAEVKGARAWCCKSLANINYLPGIEAYFNEAKYIYLYRDGRDVAVSFRKAVVGEKHFYHIAREWAATQQLALSLRDKIGPRRFFPVKYEDLTGDTEKTMRGLCGFLGAAYSDSMLDFHSSDEAQRAAKSSNLWGNVVNPVMHNNTRKFLKEASESDVRIFESVAGDVMDVLGYDRVYTPRGSEMSFSNNDISKFDSENKSLKDEVMRKVDPEDLKRRDQQSGLLQQIKARQSDVRGVMWVNV